MLRPTATGSYSTRRFAEVDSPSARLPDEIDSLESNRERTDVVTAGSGGGARIRVAKSENVEVAAQQGARHLNPVLTDAVAEERAAGQTAVDPELDRLRRSAREAKRLGPEDDS